MATREKVLTVIGDILQAGSDIMGKKADMSGITLPTVNTSVDVDPKTKNFVVVVIGAILFIIIFSTTKKRR